MGNVGYPIVVGFAGPHTEEHPDERSYIDGHGVPVCEVTVVLAALQRMVCRSYLAILRGWESLASLSEDERLSLSLYLAEVEKPPTTFYLDWFSKGILPGFPRHLTKGMLTQLHGALTHYVTETINTEPVTPTEYLALAIFNDFWDVISRIGKVGNIQTISIRIPNFEPIILNNNVLAYAAALRGKPSRLRSRILSGLVVAPRTLKRDFALVQTATHQVKVFTEEKEDIIDVINSLLHVLALHPDPENQPTFILRGYPRLWIGDVPDRFPDFVLQPKSSSGGKKKKQIIIEYKLPRNKQVFQVEVPDKKEEISA